MLRSRGVLPLSGAAQETMKSVDKKMRTNEKEMRHKAIRERMSSAVWAAIAVGLHLCACIISSASVCTKRLHVCAWMASSASRYIKSRSYDHMIMSSQRWVTLAIQKFEGKFRRLPVHRCRKVSGSSVVIWSRESPRGLYTWSTMIDHGRP